MTKRTHPKSGSRSGMTVLALGRCVPSGIVRTYILYYAMHSSMCYHLQIIATCMYSTSLSSMHETVSICDLILENRPYGHIQYLEKHRI